MPAPTYNVLFLCTRNSARSILGEAILAQIGIGRFRAYSAGSEPGDNPHPMALDVLRRNRHDTSALRSKSWDEFALPGAPRMDFIFTVCDRAANEICPVWPGHPTTAHWGEPDPAAVTSPEIAQRLAFDKAYRRLRSRIARFNALPDAELTSLGISTTLAQIQKDAQIAA